jgi:hypothetical protein
MSDNWSGKFDHLFYEFVPQETHWGDWCHSPQAYFRGETDMPGAQMTVGFQVFTKPVLLEREPHFHREEEYLVFFGAKLPDVFSSWDAEVEFYMGPSPEEMVKITITKPTIIQVPPSMWHSPLDFKRVDKPILFQAASMSGRFGSIKRRPAAGGGWDYIYGGDEARPCVKNPSATCTYCGECFADLESAPEAEQPPVFIPVPTTNPDIIAKVMAYVCEVPPETTAWGPWCPAPQAYFRGKTYLDSANYHVGFQIFTGPNDMEEAHIHQGVEEYIFFMGQDPMNIFDFEANVHFYIGEDPDHLEMRIIDKPTVVRLPPNVWHSPILFRDVKKPLLFQAAFLAGTWGTIVRHLDADGRPQYLYQGDDTRFCILRPGEKCTVCGKCYTTMPQPDAAAV